MTLVVRTILPDVDRTGREDVRRSRNARVRSPLDWCISDNAWPLFGGSLGDFSARRSKTEATSLSHDMDGGRRSVYYQVLVASGGTIGGTPGGTGACWSCKTSRRSTGRD